MKSSTFMVWVLITFILATVGFLALKCHAADVESPTPALTKDETEFIKNQFREAVITTALGEIVVPEYTSTGILKGIKHKDKSPVTIFIGTALFKSPADFEQALEENVYRAADEKNKVHVPSEQAERFYLYKKIKLAIDEDPKFWNGLLTSVKAAVEENKKELAEKK